MLAYSVDVVWEGMLMVFSRRSMCANQRAIASDS